MTIRAHFDGKVLIPDQPLDLPINGAVTLQLEPSAPDVVYTEKALLELFAEMDEDSVNSGHFVDYSRDSIYGGTIDDPR